MRSNREKMSDRMGVTDQKFHDLMRDCEELLGPSTALAAGHGIGPSVKLGSITPLARTSVTAPQQSTVSPRRLFQPMHTLRQTSSSSTRGSAHSGGLSSDPPSGSREPVHIQGAEGYETFVVSPVRGSEFSPSHRETGQGNSVDHALGNGESIPRSCTPLQRQSPRPSSATSFRDYIVSASRDSSLTSNQSARRDRDGADRSNLESQQRVRDVARMKREQERRDRHERRARLHSQVVPPQGTPDPVRESFGPLALVEEHHRSLIQEEEATCLSKISDSRNTEACTQQENSEHRLVQEHEEQMQAIKSEARRRRAERRHAEEVAALEKAAMDQLRMQTWERSRDLAWDEAVARGDLVSEESPDRRRIQAMFDAAPTQLFLLAATEREDRNILCAGYEPGWYEIALFDCTKRESVLRKESQIDAYTQGMSLLRRCALEHPRLLVSQKENCARQEVQKANSAMVLDIYKDYVNANNFLVDRELWRCNVLEAEGRMVLELEEQTSLAICYDGSSSSRQRVRAHAEAAAHAKKQWREYLKEAVQELVDEELAGRLLLQREAAKAFDISIEVPSRASMRGVLEIEGVRHQGEVERAIREAQLFQAQNSSEVSYQQQISTVQLNRIQARNTGHLKKKTVQSPVPLVQPVETRAKSRVPLKGIRK